MTSDDDRVEIKGPVWQAEIRGKGIAVAEIIQSLSPDMIQNTYPQLDEEDIAAALGFAVYAVEAAAVRIGSNKKPHGVVPAPPDPPAPPKPQTISFDRPPDPFEIVGMAIIVALIIYVLIVTLF